MAEPVPAGSDASAGTYQSITSLPPCPSCGNGRWETVTGGDSRDDPYPGK